MPSTITLGEVLDVQNGFAFKSKLFSDGEVGMPLIRIRDLKKSCTEVRFVGEYKEEYVVNAGDYLIGMDGDFEIHQWQGEPALLNQRVCRLKEFSDDIEPEYVYYAIQEKLREIHESTAFVTVRHLSSKQIKSIEIPFHPVDEQRRIVDILKRADGIRRLRKQAQDTARQLSPALFIDMFGDPATNPKGWDAQAFGKVVNNLDAHRVPIKSAERAKRKGPYPYYGASGIIDYFDDYLFDEVTLLIAEDGANLISRSTPIAFIAVGKYWVNNHAHVVTTKTGVILSYLENCLNLLDLREYLTGSAQPKLSQANLNRIPIPVPPLELQGKFVARLENIQSILRQQEAAQNGAESNFQSLLHRAFTGTL